MKATYIITLLYLLSCNTIDCNSLFGVQRLPRGGYQYSGDRVSSNISKTDDSILSSESIEDAVVETCDSINSTSGIYANDTINAATKSLPTSNESSLRQLTGGGAAGFVTPVNNGRSPTTKSNVATPTKVSKGGTTFNSNSRVGRKLMMESTAASNTDNKVDDSSFFKNDDSNEVPIHKVDVVSEHQFREIKKAGGPLKVLFLSSDTGGGHRASAEALAKHFQMYYPGTTYDLLDCWLEHGCLPYRTLVDTYKHLSAHPRRWKFLYHFSNTSPYLWVMDKHSAFTCEKRIRDGIEKYNPDVIVSVHPTMQNVPLIATEHLRKKYNKYIPFFTVVTDFGTGHCTWFRKGVDKVFIASDRLKRLAMKRAGVPEKDIVQSGLPIRRDFAVHAKALGSNRRSEEAQKYQADLRTNLNIPDIKKKMVLVMGGGEGVGSLSTIVDSLYTTLTTQGIDATVVVVCGRNEQLKQTLQTKDWDKVLSKRTRIKKRRHFSKLRWAVPSRRIRDSLKRAALAAKEGRLNPNKTKGKVDVIGLGFVTQMADYMAASDILITKAGPGTLAEAAALGLPVMITSFLPGQEAGNVNIVLDNGFGDYCSDPYGIAEEVACWIQDEDLLTIMSNKSTAIGVPDAASDIVLTIGNMTHQYMELNAAGATNTESKE